MRKKGRTERIEKKGKMERADELGEKRGGRGRLNPHKIKHIKIKENVILLLSLI